MKTGEGRVKGGGAEEWMNAYLDGGMNKAGMCRFNTQSVSGVSDMF